MQKLNSKIMINSRIKYRGFSLIELIAILTLLAIVSVTAVSKFNLSPFATAGFDQELRSAFRFAQKFAILSGCDVRLSIVAASDSYALNIRDDATANPEDCLTAVGAFGTALPNPGGGVFAGSAPSGVSVDNNLSIDFDLQGRPSAAGSVGLNGGAITINIEAVTGYIY